MTEIILNTLVIMGWLGIILGIILITNTLSGTIANVWSGNEEFSWNKFFKGIGKALIFYVSAILLSIAATMLPFVNEMITQTLGTELLDTETLKTCSSIIVIGIVAYTIIDRMKDALENLQNLSGLKSSKEEVVTWEVEEDEE